MSNRNIRFGGATAIFVLASTCIVLTTPHRRCWDRQWPLPQPKRLRGATTSAS